jgi:hypothetical protein
MMGSSDSNVKNIEPSSKKVIPKARDDCCTKALGKA